MLTDSITTIKGIGPRKAELFAKLGLFCLKDLLRYLPVSYIGLDGKKRIGELRESGDVLLYVLVEASPTCAWIKGKSFVSVVVSDDSGKTRVSWFNQPYRVKQLKGGEKIWLYGKYDAEKNRMVNPTIMREATGIQPIYSITKGLSQRDVRNAVKEALLKCGNCLEDLLPLPFRESLRLCELNYAVDNIHYPSDICALECAKRRLVFDELLKYFISLRLFQNRANSASGIAFNVADSVESFVKKLDFQPTGAQLRAMKEIAEDMSKRAPMNRLLQGDVGSGKTIVAMQAMYIAVNNGYQAVLMAPTDMLAQQHFAQLKRYFGASACLLTGNMKPAERNERYAGILSGEYTAITGTHALFQEGVEFKQLGLVITDEQHRFGVAQRAALSSKGISPDTLIMSATPIPRTLALIMYGDLEISIIDELPPNRKCIKTRVVTQSKRSEMYRFIEDRAKCGEQTYVVCPTIEPMEGSAETMSTTVVYDELKTSLSVSVGLLHGQMKPADKDAVMEKFRSGEISVLVSTTVIEVGVDVPNATVMVVESAERFGLAQLHQLRGRVGRSDKQSWCFLLTSKGASTSAERLKIMAETSDGFLVAQKDLELRGCGEFLGLRQHGESDLAAFTTDMQFVEQASITAKRLMSDNSEAAKRIVQEIEKLLISKTKTIIFN